MTEPKTRLIIVGDGEYGNAIRRQPGLDYYPYSSQVRELMRDASWLLLPSRWEQQPLVLLESLEERLPFIIGPAPEIQQFSLGDELVLHAATLDALYQCCLAAISIGRVPERYERIVNRVIGLSDKWPTPQATIAALVEVLKEASMMGSPR
jgi:glycosyltransferase involved in cell wall biosynthesis